MLVWLGYPHDELVIARAITGRERICVASRLLTTKIPSVLLVAVMWLQHKWCPRFRRDTFGYGTTTSPAREVEYEYGSFHANARQFTRGPQMHMPCNACSKSDIYSNSQSCVQDPKRTSSGSRDWIIHDWPKSFDEFGTHHRILGRITNSMNRILRQPLLKEVQSMHYIDERSRNYPWQRLGLQCRLAASTWCFLVQPTTTTTARLHN
jgi:hypothetical protein